MTKGINPLELAQALIRCPSVTPEDAGALDVLNETLQGLGFTCHRMKFSNDDGSNEVDNLYAHIGNDGANFCFAGHTDVVPAGDAAGWRHDPFGGVVDKDILYGRGAVDMKGGIACFIAAVSRFLNQRGGDFAGSISLLITGDEEGHAVNGTAKVLQWLQERNAVIDVCLVGEPSNPKSIGDMIKIGRRGSLNGKITVCGIQGHSAYPELADNPLPHLMRMMTALSFAPLGEKTRYFDQSNAQITSFDVGNTASNVIPATASAAFNIRFNDKHTGKTLEKTLRECFDAEKCRYDLQVEISGEPFITQPGKLSAIVSAAVEKVTGRKPELGTSGGTSDARFIRTHCPVVEFGLVTKTAHQVDENIGVADLVILSDIYHAVLDGFFAEDA